MTSGGKKGVSAPYMIVPITTEETISGVATLIAAGDLEDIIEGLRAISARSELIEKFERLRQA